MLAGYPPPDPSVAMPSKTHKALEYHLCMGRRDAIIGTVPLENTRSQLSVLNILNELYSHIIVHFSNSFGWLPRFFTQYVLNLPDITKIPARHRRRIDQFRGFFITTGAIIYVGPGYELSC